MFASDRRCTCALRERGGGHLSQLEILTSPQDLFYTVLSTDFGAAETENLPDFHRPFTRLIMGHTTFRTGRRKDM